MNIPDFNLSPLEMPKVKQWYQDMADAMKAEGIQKKGHLVFKSCIFLYVKNKRGFSHYQYDHANEKYIKKK